MRGEMPLCKNKPKENMLCQVCLVKYRKRRCFVKYAGGNAVFQKQAKREHALSSLSSMLGEVAFCKKKLKENMFCQVCLVKCRFAKNKLKENMLCQTLSSMPGEMLFCKKKLKENMLCHFCQVCVVKCRCAKTSRKKTCFVKSAW